MVREDLISSAVSFLQDPSVASASLDKRIAFLQSKNLTQEEIDVSLARASDDSSYPSSSPSQTSAPPSYAYRQPPPTSNYGAYPPSGYWQQPPPEPPRRDWRDYFIMATVMGGISYGLYFTAKRYILPMIAPPTPPQLEQDKASIDESFKRAFELLEQLNADTAALKESEAARTARLDTALGDVETVLASLKESSKRQGDDNRRIEDDVRGLRELIPKAMDAQKESNDARLKELSTELKSLKTLVGNRMGAGTARPPPAPMVSASNLPGQSAQASASTPNIHGASSTATSASSNTPLEQQQQPSGASTPAAPAQSSSSNVGASGVATDKPASASAFGRPGRAIPAWQMAAAAKKTEGAVAAAGGKDTSESGTAVDASTG